jgi:hypothetical protein
VSVPAWFRVIGIPEACVEKRSSCEENGRSFSVTPEKFDEIWRVTVDGCWLDEDQQKVDYLFWVKSKSGKKAIVLVELKGGDYGKALSQIDNTLRILCKNSHGNIIHAGPHQASPGHNPVRDNGVQAYVVLSQGHDASARTSTHGRKIPQRLSKLEGIRQKYRVRVAPKTKRFAVTGVDTLF